MGKKLVVCRGASPLDSDSIGITAVWENHEGILNWGESQSLAIVDDGCDYRR